jgi:phosphoenolpyruvate carboxylase
MDLLETPDKDSPLRDDIRLLGRILGDTVRSQEGEPVFTIVEHIRRTSIRFHRDEDQAARRQLKSSALSATFRSSPTSPKTNITSAGLEPTRWPLQRRAKAPWLRR